SYSSFLGGSGVDAGGGIAIDNAGNAYIVGSTTSPDFPIASAIQPTLAGPSDAFVAVINSTGSGIAYSSYLGGASDDLASAIAVDANNIAYVTGYTHSNDFPLANPVQSTLAGISNAFVAKMQLLTISVRVSPTNLNFGNQGVRRLSAPQYVTL